MIDFIPHNDAFCFMQKAGGAPANVAVMVARSENQVGFFGKVGNDQFGKFLVNTLECEGVNYLCKPTTDEAFTTLAFVHLDKDGDRTFSFARKPGADMYLSKNDIDIEKIKSTKILHAGSCSLSKGDAAEATRFAMQIANENNVIVSFDVNYRNLVWENDLPRAKKNTLEVLKYVDILKISEEESFIYEDFDDIKQFMNHYNIELVVVTKGKDGAEVYYNNEIISMKSKSVKAVDTTGAGDAFWGGFLSTLINKNICQCNEINTEIIKKAIRYGNVAGALCVQEKGAIESLPTRSMVEKILSEEQNG